jgi:uncharacterized protein
MMFAPLNGGTLAARMSASADITTRAAVRGMRIDWTPYLMGAGIGVLSWIVFAVANDPLGVTSALSAVAGFAAMPFAGAATVWHNSYWAQTVPSLSYGAIFLVGVMLGAFAASVAARQFHVETMPATWRQRFGGSISLRFAGAFIGGALEMYGARLAGGCSSGHGISGTMQLAVSSWTFTILMFGTAILVSSLLFGRAGGRQ